MVFTEGLNNEGFKKVIRYYIKEIEDTSKKRGDLIAKRELKMDAMLLSILKSLKDITEKRENVKAIRMLKKNFQNLIEV